MNIRDIPFKPRATPEQIAKGKQWLVDNKKNFSYTANFAVFYESDDGTNLLSDDHMGSACHYNICSNSRHGKRVLVATECAFKRVYGENHKIDTILPFVKWLVQESYFSRFILNGDDPKWCAENGFIISADVWTPLMQNVCIVTRCFREYSVKCFTKFAELVSKGCPGDLAFALCFTANYSGATGDNHIVTWAGSGHRTTNTFRLKSLENFLNWESKKDEKKLTSDVNHYRNNSNYTGGSTIFWGGTEEEKLGHAGGGGYKIFIDDLLEGNVFGFRDALRIHRQKGKQDEVYKAPNPFVKKPAGAPVLPAPNQMTFKELFEFFVPWFMENYYNEDSTLKERK